MIYQTLHIITMQLTPLEGQVCIYRIIQGGKLLDVDRAINRIRETIRAIEAKIITKSKHHCILCNA